jgi:hypothetical protein
MGLSAAWTKPEIAARTPAFRGCDGIREIKMSGKPPIQRSTDALNGGEASLHEPDHLLRASDLPDPMPARWRCRELREAPAGY